MVHQPAVAALTLSRQDSSPYKDAMIHVCSLARLHATVETTGAGHVVTLLKDTDRVERPRTILAANHLILGMDDISAPLDGYVMPGDEHVRRLIAFALGAERGEYRAGLIGAALTVAYLLYRLARGPRVARP